MGGVFKAKFIDNWPKNSQSYLDYFIDFEEYCKEALEGEDQQYKSTRTLFEQIKEVGAPVTHEFEGFKNSFRIIAKQNSFQKSGNVFMIDSDFTVAYTIDPSPEAKEEIEQSIKNTGTVPEAYRKLIATYEWMKDRIHDHMVKMPLCREYFAMLGVINFFSCYFSTLKKHRKVPFLPAVKNLSTNGCPRIFPHLPVTLLIKESLKINIHQILRAFAKHEGRTLQRYLKQFFHEILSKQAASTDDKVVLVALSKEVSANILSFSSRYLSEYIEKNHERIKFDDLVSSFAAQALGVLKEKIRTDLAGASIGTFDEYRYTEHIFSALKTKRDTPAIPCSNEFEFTTRQFSNDLPAQIVEYNKRIVGGCGMSLTRQKVTPIPSFLDEHHQSLVAVGSESWKSVKVAGKKVTAFRLMVEDVPAWLTDNYKWMEYLLYNDQMDPKMIENHHAAGAAILRGNQDVFRARVNEINDPEKVNTFNGATLLHTAASVKDPFFVRFLLRKALSVTAKDRNGYLPIHYAAMSGSVECLEMLYSEKKDTLNSLSISGISPLETAIQHQHEEAVSFILSKKPRLTFSTCGYTDLHCALHEGNARIISYILDYKPVSQLVNTCSEEGGTPLMLACEISSADAVEKLLALQADPSKGLRGVTPIEIAIRKKAIPILNLLLPKIYPSNLAIEAAAEVGTAEVLARLSHVPEFLNYVSGSKDNLLQLSLKHSNKEGAKYFLQYAHLHENENIHGETPLSMACSAGAWDIAEVLFKKGVKVDLKKLVEQKYHPLVKTIFASLTLTSQQRKEYLLTALQSGNYLFLSQVLMPKNADFDSIEESNGWKAIHYLAKCDGIFYFKKLVKKDDLLMPLLLEGKKTLAYIAAENDSNRVLSFLLDLMKEQNIPLTRHCEDKHLLYPVVKKGNVEIAKKMSEMFENLSDASLDDERTLPAHLAAKLGHGELVALFTNKTFFDEEILSKLDGTQKEILFALKSDNVNRLIKLYQKDISINAKIFYSYTGLHFACKVGSLGCAAWLLQQKADPLLESSDKQNAFEMAALSPSSEALKLLLEFTRMNPNKIYRGGQTLMHLAAKAGRINNVMVLIANDAFLDLKNENGFTPLHYAVKGGHLDIVRLLLCCGALPDIHLEGCESIFQEYALLWENLKPGESRLHLAVKAKNLLAVMLLAQVDNVNQRSVEGKTPLDIAIFERNKAAQIHLVKSGAKVGVKS